MWSKLYLVLIGLSGAAMAFFTFYSFSWLQSIGQPQAAVDGYTFHSYISVLILWLSALSLLLLANAVLWTTGKAWAMWLTFLYAALFFGIQYFWLGEEFFRFKKTNGFFDGSFSLGPVLGVILIVVSGIVVFANQFASVRLHRRMYPRVIPVSTEPELDPKPVAE